MELLDQYIDYFENLCVNHPDLLHDPSQGNQVFLPITIEDSFGDFTSSVQEKGFIVRPIIYTQSINSNEAGGYFTNKQGGLIIGHYYDRNDYDNKIEAINKTEKLLNEFVTRMIEDSVEGHPLWNYSFNNPDNITIQHIPMLGDGSYTGWRMIFQFSNDLFDCDAPPFESMWSIRMAGVQFSLDEAFTGSSINGKKVYVKGFRLTKDDFTPEFPWTHGVYDTGLEYGLIDIISVSSGFHSEPSELYYFDNFGQQWFHLGRVDGAGNWKIVLLTPNTNWKLNFFIYYTKD